MESLIGRLCGVAQLFDNLGRLQKRAGPAVGEKQWDGVLARRLCMRKVQNQWPVARNLEFHPVMIERVIEIFLLIFGDLVPVLIISFFLSRVLVLTSCFAQSYSSRQYWANCFTLATFAPCDQLSAPKSLCSKGYRARSSFCRVRSMRSWLKRTENWTGWLNLRSASFGSDRYEEAMIDVEKCVGCNV